MLRITASAAVCVLCTVGSAFGYIEVWDGGDITPAPTINHYENTIVINAAGTYGFRAWDESSALEEIQSITVDSGVTGPVIVTIAWDENGGNGATDLWTGNLTHATYEVELAGLEISGSIATTDNFVCDRITGTVDIGSDVDGHDINILNDVDGEIAIGDLLDGSIYVGGSLNALTVPRWWADPYNTIVVDGDVGEISIPNECSNDIFIGGNLDDELYIAYYRGTINIGFIREFRDEMTGKAEPLYLESSQSFRDRRIPCRLLRLPPCWARGKGIGLGRWAVSRRAS